MTQAKMQHFDNLHYHALRGPKTRSGTANIPNDLPLGDPGLLAPRLHKASVSKKNKWGFVPHWTQINDPSTVELLERFPEIKLIDAARFPADVIADITSCEFILSSSLHGLIISDAYGIPNYWVESSPVHKGGGFKFFDYFGSVERDVNGPISVSNIQDLLGLEKNATLEYTKGIEKLADGLVKAYPHFVGD